MAAPQSPIGSRRRLGAELRRLRIRNGLTLDEVAEQMTCSTSKISRLETGKGIPKVPDVRELMRIYGVSSDTEQGMLLRLVHDGREHGWWESLTDGVPPDRHILDTQDRYVALETEATSLLAFELTIVHGLLQTPEFVRSVISSVLPGYSSADVDRLVEFRLKRQEALYRTDPSPLELVELIDESVLRRHPGSPRVMVEQLAHLQRMADLPNVTIRVLPFTAGVRRAHLGPFVLLEIPVERGSDVVYLEGHARDQFIDNPADVERYREIFEEALGHALPVSESRALIADSVQVHRRTG